MARFIKKTSIVDAVEWTGNIKEIEDIDWIKESIKLIFAVNDEEDKNAICLIDKGSEKVRVNPGDYIVKKENKIFMMPGTVFKEAYEKVSELYTVKVELDTTEIERRIEQAINSAKADVEGARVRELD